MRNVGADSVVAEVLELEMKLDASEAPGAVMRPVEEGTVLRTVSEVDVVVDSDILVCASAVAVVERAVESPSPMRDEGGEATALVDDTSVATATAGLFEVVPGAVTSIVGRPSVTVMRLTIEDVIGV